ncbi:probable calcium-binding protein CML48 [Cynara cardunculus var. scolymus]|uniref:Calcium-binding EF-hand n=1 Tax=Cynara cardunculus var. scolymus TaxID=59895 RepID=A0A103XH87_CYNCS|nr:probable calcium-binding protein CML48 [Cynara cardunculus var. scolymus]KVH90720.1 Calcium-binding EF-hand [Cynara cardunculus var. scolymus]
MSYPHYSTGYNTSPSAPPVPKPQSQQPGVAYPYQPPPPSQQPNYSYNYGQPHNPMMAGGYGSPYGYPPTPSFPPGTHPEVIRSFQMVDMDRSGFIDAKELQQALSSGYQRFSLRTIRLLMFLFRNPNDDLRTGPKEFAELWSCLGHWRAIFERFDRDRSGKIDAAELRDALYSLGYAVPPSVLQVLISKYDEQKGQRVDLSFDSFVECGMIVKGLTEKFKEKDTQYTGSATLSYETFMTMVIPFLVAE